jgi:hypothetical protein
MMQLGVGAGVGGGGGGGVGLGVDGGGCGVGAGVGSAVGRGVGATVGRGVGAAVGFAGTGDGPAGGGVAWPGAPGALAAGAPGPPGATTPAPGPAVTSGPTDAGTPDGKAVVPATRPVGALEASDPAEAGGTTTGAPRPGPEAAGTMARKLTATTAVMIRPRTMPSAVWRWIGSIGLIGLLLAPAAGATSYRSPEDTRRRASGTGLASESG